VTFFRQIWRRNSDPFPMAKKVYLKPLKHSMGIKMERKSKVSQTI